VVAYSGEKADSSKTRLKAGATISLNSNGIASIPAFSLDKPAVMASLTFVKNRFSYEPLLAYGLDFKPWFIDNWLHYKLVVKPSFELRTGINLSTFFSKYTPPEDVTLNETILQGQRYFALELTATYKLSPNSYLLLSCWNDRGQEPGTLTGLYFNFVAERTDINAGKNILLAAAIQLFYIDYDGNNDGLFISPKISASVRNVPCAIFFQAIQPLTSNISPYPGFRWNIGISYTL